MNNKTLERIAKALERLIKLDRFETYIKSKSNGSKSAQRIRAF